MRGRAVSPENAGPIVLHVHDAHMKSGDSTFIIYGGLKLVQASPTALIKSGPDFCHKLIERKG